MSDGFVDALRYGAILVEARFTVYENGKPSGIVVYGAVSTGTFTIDRNSEQRRSGSLTIEVAPPEGQGQVTPPAILPTNPSSLLAPFGNEIYVETGVASAVPGAAGMTAVTTWTPNGLYAISTTTVDDTSIDLTCTLALYDRSWTLSQRTLKNPYQFPATDTGNVALEIEALCNKVWGQDPNMAPLQFNIVPTDAVVPTASYDQGSDPWQACLDIAQAAGYELFMGPTGIVTGVAVPDPYTIPTTWNFTDQEVDIQGLSGTGSTSLFGNAYSTPVEVEVVMTRDGIFNDISIQGTGDANLATYSGDGIETTDPPVLAEALDNNPQSPTYVGGGMGDVPNFVSSSLVLDTGAQAYADNQLQVALSSSWTVTITGPPLPGLDVDQVFSTTRPRVGLWRTRVVIDTVTQVIHYADTQAVTGRVLAQPFYTPGSFT